MSPAGSDCTRRPLCGPLQFDRLGSRPWPPLWLNLSGKEVVEAKAMSKLKGLIAGAVGGLVGAALMGPCTRRRPRR